MLLKIQIVKERRVDGEMLYMADDQVFRELGIPNIHQVKIKEELKKKFESVSQPQVQ